MLLPIFEDRRAPTGGDALIKTISTRIAGGRKEINKEPSRVTQALYTSAAPPDPLRCAGDRRYAGVPVHAPFATPRRESARHPGDAHRRGLHPHAGHLRRTEEFAGSHAKLQQRATVSGAHTCPAVLPLMISRYTQCEFMSVHYKQPILLIEFEEHKSFSFDVRRPCASSARATRSPSRRRSPT